ncbi:DNA polymerase/3'-5' exonuclease PolX [candidate division KSB1 bacterium]|nr:DNA polymerase/3'-5' exonuclease PolX [candidate division KSB1 bacterium]
MKNKQIAEIFDQIADILEFKGELVFKINAYRRAGRAISELAEDIEDLWREGRLGEISGVGKGLQEKIGEFLTTGQIAELQELAQHVPSGLFELLSVQNFGPKTAALAFKELGVETLTDLQRVLQDGSLAKLPGMGAKKVENIRKGLEFRLSAEERLSIGLVVPIVDEVVAYLKKVGPKIGRLSPAGSVRRGRETVHDIDLLAETDHGADVIKAFTDMPEVTQILGAGDTKGSVILNDRVQIDIRAVPAESFGAALQYFTGSKDHNVHLREIAKKLGYKINEYGIFANDKKIGGDQEEAIYEKLGMSWIPPELREDRGEIEAAQQGHIPQLLQQEDILADLHVHSVYSDGQLTVAEMADAVRARGYRYMAFCDHSRYANYANGMDEKRLLKQIQEIKALNSKMKDFVILTGCEVDILPDGTLDFGDEMLAQLDFVIASIHSGFKTNPTERAIRAMQNPYVDVIGHPTGRLISRREGYDIDVNAIIQEAAKTGTALEINSYWDRLDLSDVNAKLAIDAGVKISINTDAHHPEHLPMMRYGVATARRGWATKGDIINTLTVDELKKWQKRNRIRT